jgi:hypothetical protein
MCDNYRDKKCGKKSIVTASGFRKQYWYVSAAVIVLEVKSFIHANT